MRVGEAVKAIVVMKDGESLSEDACDLPLQGQAGGVKSPKSVEFWREIRRLRRAAGPKAIANRTGRQLIEKSIDEA